ncbi:anti-sigma-F factor Fin family protein [Ectobacillus panaciterrae]|uniref:anti-sigma-F factor Fin family protein n=1 Tax=Ectobacillus panaciterrae TaxID=363872 RepID=UPI0003FBDE31|nr:anti-sigma-F factor Fin family protein [Ectobacillus panaciterrae]
MNTHYYCRHCGNHIGSIEREEIYNVVLGHLTEQEKQDMLHYDENGNIYVKAICEDCQHTLENHPHYHEYESFIQ